MVDGSGELGPNQWGASGSQDGQRQQSKDGLHGELCVTLLDPNENETEPGESSMFYTGRWETRWSYLISDPSLFDQASRIVEIAGI